MSTNPDWPDLTLSNFQYTKVGSDSTKASEQPIQPARYLESSCGQCHMDVLEGTPRLNRGRRLLTRFGSARCHAITQPAYRSTLTMAEIKAVVAYLRAVADPPYPGAARK